MVSVRVTSSIGDLASDMRTITVEAKPTMARVVRRNARHGRDLARANAKRSSGKHGPHYPPSITDEPRGLLTWEYGPDSSMQQGAMSWEYGSRNQPPHLDLARSADVIGPALAHDASEAIDGLFWPT